MNNSYHLNCIEHWKIKFVNLFAQNVQLEDLKCPKIFHAGPVVHYEGQLLRTAVCISNGWENQPGSLYHREINVKLRTIRVFLRYEKPSICLFINTIIIAVFCRAAFLLIKILTCEIPIRRNVNLSTLIYFYLLSRE